MTIKRSIAKCVSFILLILAALFLIPRANAQSLTMDGESGIFLQPMADVVPSPQHKFGGPTVSFHAVDAGPVAGNYINIGVEEGFGNWLEFGYTRSNHTDGGDPTISPLFNFSGMNIFNFKAKVLPANYHGHKYLPTISVGGVLRTNDPFVVQAVKHKNATNGDVYLVGTKLFMIGKKFGFVGSAGVRGTNAQKYGYGGNTVDWEARAFGGVAFPIPIKNASGYHPCFRSRPRTQKNQVCPYRVSAHRPYLRNKDFSSARLEMEHRHWNRPSRCKHRRQESTLRQTMRVAIAANYRF